MASRIDLEIPAEGATLAAHLYVPEGATGPLPAITMAIGFAGTKEIFLPEFAKAFTDAGFVVIAHDHRNFGASTGTPRFDVNPWQQIADWRRVISVLEARPEVDASRIGLWGTSYAGGHAIVLGATDRRLKAVVANCPFVDGRQDYVRRISPENYAALEEKYNEDERNQARGVSPQLVAVAEADPAAEALWHSAEIAAVYKAEGPDGTAGDNLVTLRSGRMISTYDPGSFIARVSPTPLLMVAGTHDTMTPTDTQLAAYENALEPKRLRLLPGGGHFDPYIAQFDLASGEAVEWFTQHLS
ncbi:alpha/beta fold hydrolase [Amycolatopsis rhabdoformis]|uniref:Alpha/beta fold hydrolase n=1 Tax=Amycolatopsis rhabdoformis TaxID=1448059 RepID=A0ABZ1HYF5_9PSEU|nr:alpha/beta fold hydrolase [Amycolatopsis rhabdoformis]WSE27177.1 alpha/beta fold hydrolase [Amycolatopsis rhabdoformis]